MNDNFDDFNENGYTLWQMVGFYLLWFTSCALCLLDLYFASLAVGAVSIRLGADQWNFPAINRCALFGLAVIGVIFFFLSEARYRKAGDISTWHLLRLFAWVTGIQLTFLGLAYLLTYTLPLTG